MKITIRNQSFDNLTVEEIEALKSQLDNKLPTTWEECIKINKGGFRHESSELIGYDNGGDYEEEDKSLAPTEAHAKSVLALCQLMTIAEALNRTCVVNEYTYEVAYSGKNEGLVCGQFSRGFEASPIQFDSKEVAEHAIKYFEDLWYDYFMIEKP